MVVQDIAYVELFTRDKLSAVDYFESAMGFTRVADSVEVDRSSILLGQGDVQLVVTSGRGIWKFLDEHGDGIADIAMTCDDVAATRDAAVLAGAEPVVSRGNTAVSGFGSVVHTLVPAAGSSAGRLPPGHNWIPVGGTSRPQGRIRLLDHIAVCLQGDSIGAYADFYREAFGFSRFYSEYVTVGGQAMESVVVRSATGGVTYTLVAPDPGKESGQLDAFLERNGGPGVQHLAFLVDDIIPAVREFRDAGIDFLTTPDTYYDLLVERFEGLREIVDELRETQVLADRDEWGHLLQLFSRSPYERNTLFFELIQRRGSRGFGSSNIRALYEAVERERLTAG
ncbi:4-hydroxyphenylpyruvate dioxygenase [Streptomyces sp. BE133]|uniref:4-hydroxyphenylpyruvate dioxygenase n=1 Tax=Streptomyces sp. BE133 TaxID=3002523 RepID=UPI002E772E97|nr:4-hydroxyphenylpyruvate dioxygenase [Streptomyces sp. BE133]MEE1806756.1 4-hydroxyphenylpyruvate dioxygenase [Streptomyces sp. BE133]